MNWNLQKIIDAIKNGINMNELENHNLIIGISWYVASWKTWLCNNLITELNNKYSDNIYYFPFDYWINYKNLDSKKYLDKFYISEFELAIKNIKENKDWFLPRYDLYKKGRHINIKLWSQCIIWNNKVLYDIIEDNDETKDSQNYYNKESDVIFTFQSAKRGIYIIEWTMIFSDEQIRSLYNIRLMVKASWEERLARMFRRYNIQEAFWWNLQSETDFVKFLSDEAFDCADMEIINQMDTWVVLFQNTSNTIYAILDLLYLKEKFESLQDTNTTESVSLFYTTLSNIENTINERLNLLKVSWTKSDLQKEIEFLKINRHLIKLKSIDRLFLYFNFND